MNKSGVCAWVIFFALLEVSALGEFSFNNIRPQLLLILAIFIGLNSSPVEAALFCVFAGLLKDIFSFSFFGINTLLFGLIGFALGTSNKYIYKERISLNLLVCLISVTAYYFIYYLVIKASFIDLKFTRILLSIIAPSIVVTAFLAPFIFFILKKSPLFISRRL